MQKCVLIMDFTETVLTAPMESVEYMLPLIREYLEGRKVNFLIIIIKMSEGVLQKLIKVMRPL